MNPPRPEDWEGPFVVAALICGRVDDTLAPNSFDVLDIRERFEMPADGPLRLTGQKLLLRLSRGATAAAKITTRLIGPEQYFSDPRVAKVVFADDVAQTVSVIFELDDLEVPHPGRYGFLVRTSTGAVLTWVPFTVTVATKQRGH
jgi:hypothetical protein